MTTKKTSLSGVNRKKSIWTLRQIILVMVVGLFVLTCMLPFLNVFAISFRSKSALLRGDVSFWPVDFNTDAYRVIFPDATMTNSLPYTIRITVIHTSISMVLTTLLAYQVSKKPLRGRKFFNLLALFTMYFSGGTIPIILNIKELGMMDTQWALILPAALSTFNMIILKSFFTALPEEMEEAAIIDGATDFQVLMRVYLPLSMASLATLTLFYAVSKWNSFSDALYFVTTRSLQPLQLRLYNIIKGSRAVEITSVEGSAASLSQSVSESIESASILFATLPILVVYPFVQRYFVAGVTIGAVKG